MTKLVIATAVLATLTLPAFAQQGNTPRGEPLSGSVKATATAEEKGLITPEMRPRFQAYVVQQAPPSFAYSSDLAVGTVLPEQGVTYHAVPPEYGATQYRYTVVNSRPVLVEPTTRRVVQIIR